MCIWLIRMEATNQETLWHCVAALLPSPAVGCMFSSEPKMHWSVALLQMTRNWLTLIVLGWVDMTWGVSKTTTSVFVLTSTVSPGRDGAHHVSLFALDVPKPCMSSWFYTTWPLTVLKNGTPSWTYAYLSAHGYVLAHGGRLPCTCITSAMWPPLIEDLPILLGLPV